MYIASVEFSYPVTGVANVTLEFAVEPELEGSIP